jgi:hypothetical protein
MPSGARPDTPVFELDDAANAFVRESDPRHKITLLQAITIGGKAACRQIKDLGQRKKYRLENLSFHDPIQIEARRKRLTASSIVQAARANLVMLR